MPKTDSESAEAMKDGVSDRIFESSAGSKTCAAEDDRRYPRRPMLGVGALILDGERILMAQRGKQPLLGWWSLPGGAVETGELLAEAVRREVREETGLEIDALGVIEIFERIMRDNVGVAEYHYVLIDYVCRVTGGALQAGDDVRCAEWFDRAELKSLQITEGTLAVIEKAFRERAKFE
jgi:8-oxo-dGTP diphosphatase